MELRIKTMFIKNLKQLSKNDVLIAGGKGASLGEMTKIATQIIKDGDLVEVDANKGVVRILKRK